MRTHPSVASAHAVALLRKLNIQRMEGKFCDCVIRQYLNPGKLYLAHKSVLAASSPVLASLLPSKSVLLELQFPSTTKEVLGSLLEFIYTGILPPADQDDSLLSAATYLQIEELQQALSNSKLDSSSESDCIVAGFKLARNAGTRGSVSLTIECPSWKMSGETSPWVQLCLKTG
ncbi:hypermethylated in cancer 2 protein-like isoform X2 [Esox lucius]|nr:hypermethylated in cancer 2 protein-like isoform X2 [Esox lucius]